MTEGIESYGYVRCPECNGEVHEDYVVAGKCVWCYCNHKGEEEE